MCAFLSLVSIPLNFFKAESDNKALSGLEMKLIWTLMYYTPLFVSCFPDKFWHFIGKIVIDTSLEDCLAVYFLISTNQLGLKHTELNAV